MDIHGLESEWEEFLKKRATMKCGSAVADTPANEDESIVQFGGMIPDGETSKVEGEALKSNAAGPPTVNRKAYVE